MSQGLLVCAAIMSVLIGSCGAHAERVERTLHKVTIAVEGMMKSKSGAT